MTMLQERDEESGGPPVRAALMPPRKIVVIASLAESLTGFRAPLLSAMATRGHRVTACAPAAAAPIRDTLAQMGVQYRELPVDRAGLNPTRDMQLMLSLRRLMRDSAPDIVLSYTAKPVIYGSLMARFCSVPAVFALITGLGYGFTATGPKARLTRAVLRRLYRAALTDSRAVFFQNPDDERFFRELGLLRRQTRSVLVNGSGVDVEAFRPVPFPPSISFLMIARLLALKGVHDYARAAEIVRARHSGVPFRLVGWIDDTPDAIREKDLRRWVDAGTIEFLGKLDDVRPALADASVYVLPSHREGTPRTVLEAMAMGRPVVTTDAPGCRETVKDGRNGFLVPVGNPETLAATLERFILSPGLIQEMGRASRRMAVEKYDVHNVNTVMLSEMGLGR
jgi:glycosyltransferase involved in cell wall biosynthesis